MLAVWVLLVAGLGRIVSNTGEWLQMRAPRPW